MSAKPAAAEPAAEPKSADQITAEAAKVADAGKPPPKQTENCSARNLAECLREPEKKYAKFEEEVRQVGPNFAKWAKSLVECKITNATNKAENIINFLPDTIMAMTDALSNGLNNLANGIGNVGESLNKLADVDLLPLDGAYATIMNKIQKMAVGAVLGSEGEKEMEEHAKDIPLLLEKVLKTSATFTAMTARPEFQKIFSEWTRNYADGLVNSLKGAQPNVDKITDQFNKMLDEFSKKTGTTIGNTLVNTINSILAVIPGVGAVISAISAAGTTANNLVQACKPLAEKGAAVAQIVDATKDKIEEAKCEAYNLKKKLSGVMGKAGGGGGGKAGGGKARQKKIQRTTRRIRRLLARFTRRVGGKPPQPPF
jgi:hypothetical protein